MKYKIEPNYGGGFNLFEKRWWGWRLVMYRPAIEDIKRDLGLAENFTYLLNKVSHDIQH